MPKLLGAQVDCSLCRQKTDVLCFHGHLLVSSSGVVTGFTLTPANGDEREALWDVLVGICSLLIRDKGYIGAFLGQELYETVTALICRRHYARIYRISAT